MNNFRNHIILGCCLLFYCILWILLHPILGYILDSDAVAYLTIARRVAEGNYVESINGLWSPMNSWVIAPFIRSGYDAWLIAKVLNCFFGGCVIVLAHFLFCQLKLKQFAHISLLLSASLTMVYNVYIQQFADVLQLIFMLLYVLLILNNKFLTSIYHCAVLGLVIGVAFYAKAYSLFFFFLHFAAILCWHFYKGRITWRKSITNYITASLVAIIMVLPWTFALHKKYNVWALSGLAGKLNMSWNINSGKSFKSDISLLIPPSYPNSPSFWEDPFLSQENLSSPVSSTKHFVKWCARVVHTCLVAITCFNEISFFSLALLIVSIYYFFIRKRENESLQNNMTLQIIIITILCLPIGYLMMHIETRYIWLNIFLLMLVGAKLLDEYSIHITRFTYKLLITVFAFSFITYPILNIEHNKNKNKDLFDIADTFKKKKIKGSFTSNAIDGGRMWVIAYLSGCNFYTIERTSYTAEELIKESKRYHVDYYLFQHENNYLPITFVENHLKFLYAGEGYSLYQFIHSP